jgi:hypothetical protein
LFDLQRDPAEARNLLSYRAYHSLAVKMHGKLKDLLRDSQDHFDPGPGPVEN